MRTMRPNTWDIDPVSFIQNSRYKTHSASTRNYEVKTRVTRKVEEADKLAPGLGLADWKQGKIEKEILGK